MYGKYYDFVKGFNTVEVRGLENVPAATYIIELNINGDIKKEKIIKVQ